MSTASARNIGNASGQRLDHSDTMTASSGFSFFAFVSKGGSDISSTWKNVLMHSTSGASMSDQAGIAYELSGANPLDIRCARGGSPVTIAQYAVDTTSWYGVGLSIDGSGNANGYIGLADGTSWLATGSNNMGGAFTTFARLNIGVLQVFGDPGFGYVGPYRCWTGASGILSSSEFLAELRSPTIVKTSGAFSEYRMTADFGDNAGEDDYFSTHDLGLSSSTFPLVTGPTFTPPTVDLTGTSGTGAVGSAANGRSILIF